MIGALVVDIGGTLSFDVLGLDGRPTSATIALYKPGSAELLAPTAASVDAVNTTLDAGAYAGTTSNVSLAATTSIEVGRSYLITNATGQAEWVRVTAVTDGVSASISTPVQYTHATGSTFVGTRLSYAVAAGLCDTRGRNYRVEWTYELGGETRLASTMFDIVRRVWPPIILSTEELKGYTDMASDIYASESTHGEDFRQDIARATDDIKAAIVARGFELDQFIDPFSFKPAIARRVISNWASVGRNLPGNFQDNPETYFDLSQTLADRALTEALATNRTYDESNDGAVGSLERGKKIASVRFSR